MRRHHSVLTAWTITNQKSPFVVSAGSVGVMVGWTGGMAIGAELTREATETNQMQTANATAKNRQSISLMTAATAFHQKTP